MNEKVTAASKAWSQQPVRYRCQVVASAAPRIVDAAQRLTELCASDQRTDSVETIASELLPLCSALRHIGRRGPKLLHPRRCGLWGRPAWLWGVQSTVRRVPHGTVLILGTWNYPLLLSGAQIAQALAAGNDVWLKPAAGCESVSEELVSCFHLAGVPAPSLRLLGSSTDAAVAAIDSGVDLIVLTGAAATGRKVLAQAAKSLTPTIMELSGCDAVVVMPSADIDRTAHAIDFGLNFNSGATCISPRRLIVQEGDADRLIDTLRKRLEDAKPAIVHPAARESVAAAVEKAIDEGAVDCLGHVDASSLRNQGTVRPILLDQVAPDHSIAAADLFAPITSVIRVFAIDEAVDIVNGCPYRLAASVFGKDAEAREIASRLSVGSVAVNDLLVPTADPRLPFGGRHHSGFGVTRGDEGLLAMTVPKVVSRRRGKFAPHLVDRRESDHQTLIGALQLLHGETLAKRWAGLRHLLGAVKTARGKTNPARRTNEKVAEHDKG